MKGGGCLERVLKLHIPRKPRDIPKKSWKSVVDEILEEMGIVDGK